jgi:hypothetical protein
MCRWLDILRPAVTMHDLGRHAPAGADDGVFLQRVGSSPRSGRACTHALVVVRRLSVVAELYFAGWPAPPVRWQGLQRSGRGGGGGGRGGQGVALLPIEVWLSSEAAGGAAQAAKPPDRQPDLHAAELQAWRWVHGQLSATAARNAQRQRAAALVSIVRDTGQLHGWLRQLRATGFPLLFLTAGSAGAGRHSSSSSSGGGSPQPAGSGDADVASRRAAPATAPHSSPSPAQPSAAHTAPPPDPAPASGRCSQQPRSLEQQQSRLDGLLFGAYGRPATLAAALQQAVRSLPREAPGVQLLVASFVLPHGRCARAWGWGGGGGMQCRAGMRMQRLLPTWHRVPTRWALAAC